MSKAYTKWLKQTIAEMQEHAELFPGDIDADHEKVLKALRIALASLEAEPVAYIFKHPAGRLFWSLTDESNKGQSDVMPVYTAPPAPVSVPDERPSLNNGVVGFDEGWNACRAAMLQEAK